MKQALKVNQLYAQNFYKPFTFINIDSHNRTKVWGEKSSK